MQRFCAMCLAGQPRSPDTFQRSWSLALPRFSCGSASATPGADAKAGRACRDRFWGRPRSDQEAFRWFSRAADQGHSHAMLVLAGLYAIGRGTSNDNVKTYKWAYIVSVGTRVKEFRNGARQLMGVLETRMTPEQINQAKVDAGGWRAVRTQAKPVVPTDNVRPDSQPPPAAAASNQSPASPATSSANSISPQGPRSSRIKKDDMDAIL